MDLSGFLWEAVLGDEGEDCELVGGEVSGEVEEVAFLLVLVGCFEGDEELSSESEAGFDDVGGVAGSVLA